MKVNQGVACSVSLRAPAEQVHGLVLACCSSEIVKCSCHPKSAILKIHFTVVVATSFPNRGWVVCYSFTRLKVLAGADRLADLMLVPSVLPSAQHPTGNSGTFSATSNILAASKEN